MTETETNAPITPPPAASESAFPLTELGNAERLVYMFGDRIRYSPAFGWLVWDGKRWAGDENRTEVSRWYFYAVREIAVEADRLRDRAKERAKNAEGDDEEQKKVSGLFKTATVLRDWAKTCESNAKRNSTLAIAETLPGVPVRPNELDRHPWLLNAQNGTIDLLTGRIKPHDRADLITKICPVAFTPDAACPLWLKCLETWQPGRSDATGTWKDGRKGEEPGDVRDFLARAAGYTLTGSTREHSVLFLYGDGGNGKSVFINTLERLLGYTGDGGYATRIPFSALSDERRSGGVTPELARLVGARLVIASEPTAGQRFNDGTLKNLASSDKLTVNPKFKDQFDFDQTHTPWIIGNVKPGLNTTDNGMLRRLPLIPFDVKIKQEDKDPELEAKLQAEAEGILAWAVRGCLEWLRRGLDPPPSVIEATAEYHEENNPFSGFFESRTVWGNTADGTPYNATLGEILDAFKSFTSKGDDFRMPHEKQFAAALRARGAENKTIRRNGKCTKCWIGVGVTDGPAETPFPRGGDDHVTPAVTTGRESVAIQPSKTEAVTPVTAVTPEPPIARVHARAHVSNTIPNSTVTGVTPVTESRKPPERPAPVRPVSDSPFGILSTLRNGVSNTLPTLEEREAAKAAESTAPVLPPVVWTRDRLNKHADEQWHLICVDDAVPEGESGAGEGWGDTKAQALDDALSDPYQTDQQRAALENERAKIESQEGADNAEN